MNFDTKKKKKSKEGHSGQKPLSLSFFLGGGFKKKGLQDKDDTFFADFFHRLLKKKKIVA